MSACFGRINFKLGKFPYFKALFPAALIDIHLLVLIKRGNVYQSWRNPRLTRLWNNERIQRQWTWTPPLAQKCRWKGNLKSRRIKQKSAKVNQIIYCSFEFQDQFRATSFLHYVLKSSTSYCGRFMGNEACQKKQAKRADNEVKKFGWVLSKGEK